MELSNIPGFAASESRSADVETPASQVERLRAELAAERSARQNAEREGALKDEFLAVVAHELRAPLGAILGWAHMLRRRSGPEDLDKGLEVIEQSVQVQAKLIEDLLVASRMASNSIRLDVAPVDLAAIIEAAVESVRPAAADKDVALHKRLELPAPALRGDPARLRQALVNLLANAVKFTPRGGEVRVSMRIARGFAVVSVQDTGAGIAAQSLPLVFDRFRQDPAAVRAHGGLGLGLAIARHLVELHGGEISAQSEGEGRGATFTVRLPL